MESKLKFKFLGIVMLLFTIILTLEWYKNLDYVEIYNTSIERDIPVQEYPALSKLWKMDNKKRYKAVAVQTIKKTKTSIPLFFDEEVMSVTKEEVLENRNP